MTEPGSASTVQRLSARGYQALLALYPALFRAEYGEEMVALFEQQWLEAYSAAGYVGVGRWLLLTLADVLRSICVEHGETMAETIEANPQARREVTLGALFLVGTWGALLGTVYALAAPGVQTPISSTGLLAGAAVVVLNAAPVARALTRSTRYAALAGMAALANTVLVAGLLAMLSGAARLGGSPVAAGLVGLLAIAAQVRWLWGLRGDDFEPAAPWNETGD